MKMLVCSIGSRRREATLRFAEKVARATAAETMLLGIVDAELKAEGLAQVLKERASDLFREGIPADSRVEVGDAEPIALAEMERVAYDLVVVGALGGKRSRRWLLTSVGMRIIEQARSSVLVVKGDRPSLSRILICASGTEYGHMTVLAGASLACAAGAKATVLHVVNAMPAMYTGLEQMEETLAELLQSDTEMARELVWATDVVRAECEISEVKLRRGIVADEILREAHAGDNDLIVVGSSRSASGLVRVLMGDLCRELIARAQRPILVVRPPERKSNNVPNRW